MFVSLAQTSECGRVTQQHAGHQVFQSRGNKTPRFVNSHYATQQTRVKQGIKYFFGSFISTFLWYLCIYRSESKNQNENFKYHIYCIHVLNGFVKMNCMLPLKALKYILLVCNKIKVNGKKLSYILLLFKHIVQHIWLWISIWTFSSTWSICFISLNVSMQNLQRNVFFFTLNFKRGHYCQFTFWQMCLFNSLCTIWRLGCAKHISDTC